MSKRVNNPNDFRQGDVYFRKVSKEAVNLEGYKERKPDNGKAVLAYGEFTGHHHSICLMDHPGTKVWEKEVGGTTALIFEVEQLTTITHQEHAPTIIQPGIYIGGIQTEYDPEGDQRVRD